MFHETETVFNAGLTISDRSAKLMESLLKLVKEIQQHGKGGSCENHETNPIAFYAALTKHTTLSGSQTVVYDKIYTNLGQAYDSSNGKFRAPVNGLYYFSCSQLSYGGSFHFILVKNNSKLGHGYGDESIDSGSVTGTVVLDKGDVMSVQHHPGVGAEKVHGDEYSTFTGASIFDLESHTITGDPVGSGILKSLKDPVILTILLLLADVLPQMDQLSLFFFSLRFKDSELMNQLALMTYRSASIMESLLKLVKEIQQHGRSCEDHKKNPVAFYAGLTKYTTLSGSQTIVFDKIYTNLGQAYDSSSGKFRAPVNGLYYFACSLLSAYGPFHFILVKNNNKLSHGYGDESSDSGSVTGTVILDKDDVVSVQHNPVA
ncbi:unnamed protein product [Mytilus coruscus]|uniref:C1q domain-containing protein n=1 Tax=Mytilus coruscus TaxID=42192 RepID=A0A6J8C5E3_MYTCO|nr:unnamed protein product [Mytilus coruscus]